MISVVDYDPSWPDRFASLSSELESALHAASVTYTSIEHVGSTSVPGLSAKPIIDCDIVVAAGVVQSASSVLGQLGFRALGTLGIPQRWAFASPARLRGSNVYVIQNGSLALRNHLGLRDVLRTDSVLRDEYGSLKRRLATEADDIDDYVALKSPLIQRILE